MNQKIRDEVLKIVSLKLYKWYRNYPDMPEQDLMLLWNDEDEGTRNVLLFRADRILSLSGEVDEGKCPQCKGQYRLLKYGCLICKGTGTIKKKWKIKVEV